MTKNEQNRLWYEKNKKRILADQAKKYAANREARRAILRSRYAAKKALIGQKTRDRYANDPEYRALLLNRQRQSRAANLHTVRARDRAYAETYRNRNPEASRLRSLKGNHIRRARARHAFVEDVDPQAVFIRDKGICGICRQVIDPTSRWHLDHVIPLSKGGLHSYDNVQASHARCNLSKNGRLQEGQMGLFQKVAEAAK